MILLDTHIGVRWLAPWDQPLPDGVAAAIDNEDDVAVSAVSCWEVAYLSKRGRLTLGQPVQSWMDAALSGSGIRCISLDAEMSTLAAGLTDIHRDPADRFIIATALVTKRRLLTQDEMVGKYISSL
jgi:PIN domain nuclease of toxin-antitoxin system